MLLHAVLLSLCLFSLGLYGLFTRRSSVGLFMAIEMMVNAAILNFVAFNRFLAPEKVDGQVMAIFGIAVAAAEVLAGLAILIMLFRRHKNVDISGLNSLRH
jgi:NADH:ubiquinone oxidoreductase subunit K